MKFVLIAALVGATVNASLSAAPPTTVPTTQPAAAGSLDAALAALQSGDFAAAADLADREQARLQKARTKPTDPLMVNAVHVQGVALMNLGQFKRAGTVMQRIYAAVPGNRSLLINLSVCDIADNELVARAVKNLQGYAAAHPTDEQVLNLWGAAVDTIQQAGKSSKVPEMWAAYARVNGQLEATRPGERRWGPDWLPMSAVAAIERNRQNQQRLIDAANVELKRCVAQYDRAFNARKNAEGDLIALHGPTKCSWWGDDCVNCTRRRARHTMNVAEQEMAYWRPLAEGAKVSYDREVANLPKPRWAVPMQAVEPELMH